MIQGSVGSLYSHVFLPLILRSLGFMVWASNEEVLFSVDKKQSKYICSNRLSPDLFSRGQSHTHCPDPGKLLCYILYNLRCFDNLDDSSCKPRAVDGEHLCPFGLALFSISAPLCSLSRTLWSLSSALPVGKNTANVIVVLWVCSQWHSNIYLNCCYCC